jgi:hypothetical protein
MNLKRRIPDYFVTPRNSVIQVTFTVLFAYAFILVYHPFGSHEWFRINTGQFAFYAGFVVVLGMLVVIISRVIMTQIRKRFTITIAGYAAMIGLEVLAMTGFYMMIQKVFLHDPRFWFEVYYTAIFNTTLILLIPYLISLLYFAWHDDRLRLKHLQKKRIEPGKPRFVAFSDEGGETRMTLKLDDLLYVEANENYVFIHFLEGLNPGRYLLRNSMKRIEEQLAGLPVIRCHRSYIVNTERIKLARKGGNGLILQINAPGKIELPVSEKYRTSILNSLKG